MTALVLLALLAGGSDRLPIQKTAAGAWTFHWEKGREGSEQLAVELTPAKGRASHVELAWPAYAAPFVRSTKDNAVLFAAGEEHRWHEVSVISLELDAATGAVLVTQTRGFEWIHRNHELLAVVNGVLTRVWSLADSESGFPGFWNTELRDVDGDGHPEVVARYWAMMTREAKEDEPPEDWDVVVVRWDAKKRSARQVSARDAGLAVWAVIVGSFETVEKAKARRTWLLSSCRKGGSWKVLSTNRFAKLEPGLIVVMRTFLDRVEAQRTLDALAACRGVGGYLKRAL